MSTNSPQSPPWAVSIRAGSAYVLIVFVVAFGLGTLRVLLVAPRVGATVAVLLEAPIMLAVSWTVSRGCTQRWNVPAEIAPRVLMGAFAFTVLMMAELGVSVLAFGNSLTDYFARFGSVAGIFGLATQVCFAFIPIVQAKGGG